MLNQHQPPESDLVAEGRFEDTPKRRCAPLEHNAFFDLSQKSGTIT